MDDTFRMERYRRSDREQVFALMRVVYRPHEVAREIKQWDWKHDRNPFNAEAERYRIANRPRIISFVRAAARPEDFAALELRGGETANLDEPYCMLLKKADELAGTFCFIPQRFMISGAEHWAIIGSNFIVHPAYRGHQLGVRMGLTMRADNGLNLNFGNQSGQRSLRSINRASFSKRSEVAAASGAIESSQRLMPLLKPIDWYEVAGHLSSSTLVRKSVALVGSGFELARRSGSVFRKHSSQRIRILEVDSLRDGIDEFWKRVHRVYPVIAVRDRRYLDWRFAARPDVSYRYLVALADSNLVGYMVFRMADLDGMACGNVVDFLIENRSSEVFSLLLKHAEPTMKDEGAKAIVFGVASMPYRSMLWRSGYFPGRTASTPHLNTLRLSSDPALEVFTDLRQWFVTMGDGNLDFFN